MQDTLQFTAEQLAELRRHLRALDKVLGDVLDGKLEDKKKKTRAPRQSTLCPSDLDPNQEDKDRCKEHRINWMEEVKAMHDWSVANANRQVARKSDWKAAFRMWINRRIKESIAGTRVESDIPVTRAGKEAERAQVEANEVYELYYKGIVSELEKLGSVVPAAIVIECSKFEKALVEKVKEGSSRYVHRHKFVKRLMDG